MNKETIEVPFVPQAGKSGIGRRNIGDHMSYERSFGVDKTWYGKCILLHFGAVDYKCRVYINGHYAGRNEGGHLPFTLDITDFLNWNEETITVEVTDYQAEKGIPRGKQYWHPDGKMIWYTPCSGIWQSVWLEPTDPRRIEWIKFDSDIDAETVTIRYALSEAAEKDVSLAVEITFLGELVYRSVTDCKARRGSLTADICSSKDYRGDLPAGGRCWSPESPSLFDVSFRLLAGSEVCDRVLSYFGMRKIEVREGKVYLNNAPYYQKLLLDQGYWKDCLWTAPSEDCYKNDIQNAKAMGFNGCRKHEKTEDPLFLYWADRLGFIVWESMPSCWEFNPEMAADFADMWKRVIHRDYNHPCIFVWNLLNENWGVPALYDNVQQQNFVRSLYYLVKALDPSRLAIANDGWLMSVQDICAFHSYRHGDPQDTRQQKAFAESLKSLAGMEKVNDKGLFAKGYKYHDEPVMLTECGGILQNRDEHTWGYSTADTGELFLREYERIVSAVYASDILCGFCYTQLADVEQEQNGLLDEEHRPKIEPALIKAINDARTTL